ncbi:MAG: carbohydrate ABC transporter permease [Spirochaetaceae bacterium]|nr:carbohydrate ABC transporter permease [Spirochaetaceae bacterium]MCF7948507.1 carbohydrate ABC transporter permease [Spirochaetia bacterium]MCF7951431.1 carbohydrate ABC transporter permease [Spirochaetaceae bacterium]
METRQVPINKPPASVKVQRVLKGVPMRLILLAIILIWVVPILGLLVSSFRTPEAINNTGWWTVFGNLAATDWTLSNYISVLYADFMGLAFLNSMLVTIPSTVIPITIAAFAAYAIAWMDFPGREAIFVIIVGLLVVPLQMALIPVLKVYTANQLNGTYLGIWLAHTGFGLPLATYLLYGYISGIPKEIIESAHADGATPWMSFTRLVLPLSKPAIASFAIFQFLWVWNDLLVALVFLGTKKENALVTTRLAEMVGSRGQDWHVLTSGAFLTMIMPLIIFFSLQRYFVRGMMAGSVKG